MSQSEYSHRKRVPKRENFLQQMNQIIPWKRWVAMISPFYPEGKRGRPPKGIECMLRMYLMQAWFNLSDEGIEDAIYDSYSMKKFLGIDFRKQQVPDATTLLKFRHLLEEHDIGRQIFDDIRERLQAVGLMMQGGSIVDATIIQAPSSTKNASKTRDPEMHQTKKGNQWYHGMKIHSGVDAMLEVATSIRSRPQQQMSMIFAKRTNCCARMTMCCMQIPDILALRSVKKFDRIVILPAWNTAS